MTAGKHNSKSAEISTQNGSELSRQAGRTKQLLMEFFLIPSSQLASPRHPFQGLDQPGNLRRIESFLIAQKGRHLSMTAFTVCDKGAQEFRKASGPFIARSLKGKSSKELSHGMTVGNDICESFSKFAGQDIKKLDCISIAIGFQGQHVRPNDVEAPHGIFFVLQKLLADHQVEHLIIQAWQKNPDGKLCLSLSEAKGGHSHPQRHASRRCGGDCSPCIPVDSAGATKQPALANPVQHTHFRIPLWIGKSLATLDAQGRCDVVRRTPNTLELTCAWSCPQLASVQMLRPTSVRGCSWNCSAASKPSKQRQGWSSRSWTSTELPLWCGQFRMPIISVIPVTPCRVFPTPRSRANSKPATLATVKPPRDLRTRLREDV